MPRHSLLILLLLVVFTATGWAREYRCQEPPQVFIDAADDRMIAEICAAADQAIGFLARFQLIARRAIHIRLLERPIQTAQGSIHGGYSRSKDNILLTSFEAIVKQPGAVASYPGAFDKIHYASLVAHEVAHAVVQHNLISGEHTIAQEYLAYSTQLGVMPVARRAKLIAAAEVSAWDSGQVISGDYLAMAPGKFAVKSYLHLVSLENPRPFVDLLLKVEGWTIHLP